MNPRKPQRSVNQPYYYIGPKVSFRKTPGGRLIRVQGYPALPPVAITMACLGYMMLHSEGVWAVAGIVLLALGLMLAGPEATMRIKIVVA